ncbi:hypothetical protein GL279_18745 [Paracoccus limosus]|uniref:Uncharacterized protein n=1 Tax=Paracoccus limosus TaxID=913252 RepID=A0A844HA60_9RHOB|nr:hypothetical protein [Paracoccus limosus]
MLILRSPWGDEAPFAHVAIEAERPVTSALLGPDGSPLRYATPALGFDLRGRG